MKILHYILYCVSARYCEDDERICRCLGHPSSNPRRCCG